MRLCKQLFRKTVHCEWRSPPYDRLAEVDVVDYCTIQSFAPLLSEVATAPTGLSEPRLPLGHQAGQLDR